MNSTFDKFWENANRRLTDFNENQARMIWEAATKPHPWKHRDFAHPTFMLGPDTPREVMLELESYWEAPVITYSTDDEDNEDFPITARWLSERYNVYRCTLLKGYETPPDIKAMAE